jgi:limonene-1,2-epoxide hydrolase
VTEGEPAWAGGRTVTPAELPGAFAQGWALPKPEPFLDFFMPLIHEQAVFTQPLLAPASGHAEIEAMFRRLFLLMPEFIAVPLRSAVEGDVVFIESRCVAGVSGTHDPFDVCDRFVMMDGRIYDRRSFFDPAPVVRVVARRPWLWPSFARGRGRGRSQARGRGSVFGPAPAGQ